MALVGFLLLGAIGVIALVIWQTRSPAGSRGPSLPPPAPEPLQPGGQKAGPPQLPPAGPDQEEVTEFTLAVTGTRPFLRTVSGPGPEGNLFLSATGVTVIGRSRENDIVIAETAASARHCRIEQQGNTFVLVDLNSTNKTWVNGVEADRVVLKNGDQITVGDTTMVFALFGDRA